MDRWLLKLVYEYQGYGITLYVLITTLAAGLLATAIGMERQLKGEAAGIRTHALLAVASSLLMTISIWAIRSADGSIDIISGVIDNSSLNYDTSRIAAGVVTGIGFLGGGVIIRDRFSVRGLATAASLLICAAVGLACGSGFILEAAMSTGVVLLILHFWGRILEILDSRRPAFIAEASCDTPLLQMIREFALQHGISLKHADVVEINEEKVVVKASFDFPTQTLQLEYFCHHLLLHENVRSAHVVIKSNGHVRDLE